jgi:polyisoprenoid-binding protein YceI
MAWTIDDAHSEILFSARHMMIATVRGKFARFSGTIEADEQNPTAAQVHVEIEAASIDTGNEQRDTHLRSGDFLNVEQFPQIVFKGTKVEQLDDEQGRLHGELTIRDVTRPVVLEVEFAGLARSPWGTTSAGFSASTRISRKDWGLNWNVALETGGWLVSDEIKVTIDLELVKSEQEAEQEAQKEAESLHNS